MSTYESVNADIKRILDLFDRFVVMYELDNWLPSASVEDIKNSFKLTKSVEEAMEHLNTKKSTDIFINVLRSWWKVKGRTKIYSIDFFQYASDTLLCKFFTNSSISPNITDIAIRIYTTIYTKERFEKCLNEMILKLGSYEAILDFTITYKGCLDVKELEYRLLLRSWANEVECGRLNDVRKVIENMLLSYKIETYLSTLIGILSLHDVNDKDENVKKIVLEYVESKIVSRSILVKTFWSTLFTIVDKKCLSRVCLIFPTFLKNLLDLIIYLGCTMNSQINNSELNEITKESNNLCSNVTYENLLNVVKFLYGFDIVLKRSIEMRIEQAKTSTNCKLWERFEKDLRT